MTASDLVKYRYQSSSIKATTTKGLCYIEALDCNCSGDDCGQPGGDDCNNCT